MPGSPEICLKPTRLTLNTRQFKKGTPNENCRLWYGIYRYIVQRRIQNPVKHLRRGFFGKIANDEYKLLSDYIYKKNPSWMFDRVLNRSMKFMRYYIFYVMVVSKVMTSIISATLPGVETLITNPPFIGIFLLTERWKNLRALGTRLPTKIDILKVYYYTSKTTTSHRNHG